METIKKNGSLELKSASMEEWLQRRKDITNQLLKPLTNHLECQISAINYFIQEHYENMKINEYLIYIHHETERYELTYNFLKSLLEFDDEMDEQLKKVKEKLSKVDNSNEKVKA
jgi:hypothetical protein